MPKAHQGAKGCSLLRNVQCAAIMAIDTQWFTDRLAARKMSGRQLAKLMGIDSSAVSLMLRGKRKMSLDEAAQLAVLLNVPHREVLERSGVELPPEAARVKVIGYLNPDASVSLVGEGAHDMIDAPINMPNKSVAIQARTSGSELAILDGYIYFLAEEHGSPQNALGHLSLVAIKGNGLKMSVVSRGYAKGTYNLLDLPNKVTTNVELAWASPVLWIKTMA